MKISARALKIFNLLTLLLFLLPAGRLDPFKENYSPLSLKAEGHLFLLFLGLATGLVMGCETWKISGKRNGVIVLIAMILGTAIPHHVPYDLQGNLHLLFGYCSFAVLICITYLNALRSRKRIYLDLITMTVLASALLYMRCMMVSTLSEILIMAACLFIDLSVCLEKTG